MMDATNALPLATLLALGAVHGINPGMGWLFAAALGLQEGRARAVWRALPALALGHAVAIAAVLALAAFVGVAVPVEVLRWIVAATLLAVGVTKLLRQRHPRYGGMRVSWRQLAVWSFLMASAHGAGLMVMPIMLMAEHAALADHTIGAANVETSSDGRSRNAHQHGRSQAGAAPRVSLTAAPVDDAPADAAPATDAPATAVAATAVPAIDPPAATARATGSAGHEAHMAGILTDISHAQIAGAIATAVHTAGYLLVTGILAWLVFARLGVRILRTAWINLDLLWALALIATAVATPFLR
jgi:hypothetical protein